ncbi:PilW family protein [Variovorax sp. J22R133]|uniref:PilW family protein n=1 Tax=Variovorax brevis TaxID=3053503 RepID=UPI0025752FA2|nr:PilW family protein [Variovorax sp. J22R133]MDM0115273.1 PilW family protein [Variovorax sp. J22R133]
MPILRTSRQRGFSLVEILVGMVVGLVVTIIIYQVVATNEGVKRSTTSGADTQQNGIFSLTTIERDVRAAGWGIPAASSMPCANYYTYFNNGATSGPVPNFPGTAVRINDGGTAPGASDSITMLWGSSVRANVLNALLQNVTLSPTGTAAASLRPTTKVGMSSIGGFVWLTDDIGNCVVTRITASTDVPTTPPSATMTVVLAHDPIASPTPVLPSYNPPAAYMTANAWPVTFNTNPRIFDAGALTQRTYAVVNGSLVSQDYFTTTDTLQVSNNVVSLKAQYGISDAGSQIVNNWVRATNGAAGNWALPTANDLRRIKAIHVAVVVRSPLKERPTAGTTTCATTAVAPTSWPGGPVIDLSNDPDWKCYRYRTFETVVPLRNVLWANLS